MCPVATCPLSPRTSSRPTAISARELTCAAYLGVGHARKGGMPCISPLRRRMGGEDEESRRSGAGEQRLTAA